MQHREGSNALKPHSSSRSKPLESYHAQSSDQIPKIEKNQPHAKHINQMLLSNIVLLIHIPLQCCENIPLAHKIIPRPPLNLCQRLSREPILLNLCRAILRWNREILKFLSKNDNCLLGYQWVLRRGRTGKVIW